MGLFLACVISGILQGGTFALVSLALVLVFRSTGTFNVAGGEVMIIPILAVAMWQKAGLAGWLGVIIALTLGALLSLGLFFIVLRHTIGGDHMIGFVATLGVAAVMDAVISLWFGSNRYDLKIPGVPRGTIRFLGIGVSEADIAVGVVAYGVCITMLLVMQYTGLGIRIRATGQMAALASQRGINVRSIYYGCWALAGALGAFAGLSYAATNIVDSNTVVLGLAALPAIILGGLDSFTGAVVGGLIIGLFQAFLTTYIGGQYVTPGTYTILFLVLMVWPSGLFGSRIVERL